MTPGPLCWILFHGEPSMELSKSVRRFCTLSKVASLGLGGFEQGIHWFSVSMGSGWVKSDAPILLESPFSQRVWMGRQRSRELPRTTSRGWTARGALSDQAGPSGTPTRAGRSECAHGHSPACTMKQSGHTLSGFSGFDGSFAPRWT
jgi:hypothetical protein